MELHSQIWSLASLSLIGKLNNKSLLIFYVQILLYALLFLPMWNISLRTQPTTSSQSVSQTWSQTQLKLHSCPRIFPYLNRGLIPTWLEIPLTVPIVPQRQRPMVFCGWPMCPANISHFPTDR